MKDSKMTEMVSVAKRIASQSNIVRSNDPTLSSYERILSDIDIPAFFPVLMSQPAGEVKVGSLSELLFILEYGTSIVLSSGSDNDRENIDTEHKTPQYTQIDIERHNALKQALKDQGYRFIEVEGNYGTPEKSLIVLIDKCFDEKDMVVNHLPSVIALLEPFEQDSVLMMVRGMFFYYFLRGNDRGKMLDSNTIEYAMKNWEFAPTEFYTDVAGIIFRCDLNFDKPLKPANQLLDELRDLRYGQYNKFTLSPQTTAHQVAVEAICIFVILRGLYGIDAFAQALFDRFGEHTIQISSTDASRSAIERDPKNAEKKSEWEEIRDNSRKLSYQIIQSGFLSDKRIVLHAGMNKEKNHVDMLLELAFRHNIQFPKHVFVPLVVEVPYRETTTEQPFDQRHLSRFELYDNPEIKTLHLFENDNVAEAVEKTQNEMIAMMNLAS